MVQAINGHLSVVTNGFDVSPKEEMSRVLAHIEGVLNRAESCENSSSPPIIAEKLVGQEALKMFYQRAGTSWMTGPAQVGLATIAATAAVAAATVQAVATLAAKGSFMDLSRPLAIEGVRTNGLSASQLMSLRETQVR